MLLRAVLHACCMLLKMKKKKEDECREGTVIRITQLSFELLYQVKLGVSKLNPSKGDLVV